MPRAANITDEQRLRACELHAAGKSYREIASEVGISTFSVHGIINRKKSADIETSKHVEAQVPPSPAQEPTQQPSSFVQGAAIEELLIGRPRSSFTSEEVLIIQERLEQHPEVDNPRCPRAVLNAIYDFVYCELQFARIAATISCLEASGKYSKAAARQYDERRKLFFEDQKRAGGIIARYRADAQIRSKKPEPEQRAGRRGRPSNDNEQDAPQTAELVDTWVQLHQRYKAELDKMRKEGVGVGCPSKEEIDLANSKFESPVELEIKGAITDQARAEIIASEDSSDAEELTG